MARLPFPGIDGRSKWIRYKRGKSLNSNILGAHGIKKRKRKMREGRKEGRKYLVTCLSSDLLSSDEPISLL